jgi:hypothetical protein
MVVVLKVASYDDNVTNKNNDDDAVRGDDSGWRRRRSWSATRSCCPSALANQVTRRIDGTGIRSIAPPRSSRSPLPSRRCRVPATVAKKADPLMPIRREALLHCHCRLFLPRQEGRRPG